MTALELPESKVLVYTVSRATTPQQVQRAFESLLTGQRNAGIMHEWILWCNSASMLEAGNLLWQNGQLWNDGINKGQHIALIEILKYANANGFDYIVKVDDDVEWITRNWLRKLVRIEAALHKFTNNTRHSVIGPKVRGLINPVVPLGGVKIATIIGKIPLHVVQILGGLCRLHHISFFDDYVPDARRAMGAGGDTSIALHAEKIQVPMFQSLWVQVGHHTERKMQADPEYYNMQQVFQALPYIPRWHPPGEGDEQK